MGKSVYSIVLMDEVVMAVDAMASAQGTSRSNMINRILAENVSVPTLETNVKDIFSAVEDFFAEHSTLQTMLLGTGQMINMKTALQYKYNPSVKYSVEIYPHGEYLGEFRVSMRTQNSVLIDCMEQFYHLWIKLEKLYLDQEREYIIENNRFARKLNYINGVSYVSSGNVIAQYINLFDRCMKTFFRYISQSQKQAITAVNNEYKKGITELIAQM